MQGIGGAGIGGKLLGATLHLCGHLLVPDITFVAS
jgi:hypothetical protein